MRHMRVIRGGLSTTVQDLGRPHLRHFGIAAGGAMDRVSHELANRLAGNTADFATLEMTLSGDELEWSDDTTIAVTGADFRPIVTSRCSSGMIIPMARPVCIRAGTRIRFQTTTRGCRCYVAVNGGFDVPRVMGSRSTYLRAMTGGHCGRVLRAGDELVIGRTSCDSPDSQWRRVSVDPRNPRAADADDGAAFRAPAWFVRPVDLPGSDSTTLRVLPGADFDRLTEQSRADLWARRFAVTAQSDRMGYRLSDCLLQLGRVEERHSAGIAVGTIQLPPDGNPILLMADSAPTGGYPRIAHVIAADLPAAAQLRPGQAVRFAAVSLDEAHRLLRQQRKDIRRALIMADLLVDRCSERRLSTHAAD